MRSKILWVLTLFCVCVTFIAGCGSQVSPSSTTPTATPTETKPAVKMAGVFSTPIEEPWPNVIHQACEKVSKENGFQYDMTENIGYTDFERVLRDYCQRGYTFITGDSFGNEEVTRRVAKDYPKIAFCFGSELGPVEPNFSVFDNWIIEPAYLCGMIAGKLTKSNVIGLVAEFDIPEVNRIANAYVTGAKEVNPNITVKGTYIGSFYDPPKAKEAALGVIEAGADVMFALPYGVIEACAEKKIPVFGNIQDQSSLAPEFVVTGPVWDMYPTIKAAIEAVKAGFWQALDYGEWSFMRKGGSFLAPYHDWETKLSQEIKDMVKTRTQEILDGKFRVPNDEQTIRFNELPIIPTS